MARVILALAATLAFMVGCGSNMSPTSSSVSGPVVDNDAFVDDSIVFREILQDEGLDRSAKLVNPNMSDRFQVYGTVLSSHGLPVQNLDLVVYRAVAGNPRQFPNYVHTDSEGKFAFEIGSGTPGRRPNGMYMVRAYNSHPGYATMVAPENMVDQWWSTPFNGEKVYGMTFQLGNDHPQTDWIKPLTGVDSRVDKAGYAITFNSHFSRPSYGSVTVTPTDANLGAKKATVAIFGQDNLSVLPFGRMETQIELHRQINSNVTGYVKRWQGYLAVELADVDVVLYFRLNRDGSADEVNQQEAESEGLSLGQATATRWLDKVYPVEQDYAGSSLVVGADILAAGELILKVEGTALIPETIVKVMGAGPDFFYQEGQLPAGGHILKISLIKDARTGQSVSLKVGDVLQIAMADFNRGQVWWELTLPSGDAAHYDYNSENFPSAANYRRIQNTPFSP